MEILGIYARARTAAVGVRTVLDEGLGDVITYSPVPDHALDQALHVTVSPVRLFVLIGGLLGCATGFIFPIYTVLDWPVHKQYDWRQRHVRPRAGHRRAGVSRTHRRERGPRMTLRIREGGRNMPASAASMSADERWALVHFVRTFKTPGVPQ